MKKPTRQQIAAEAARQLADMDRDPYAGWCFSCRTTRTRSECRQDERDETCVYVCRVCGNTVSDEIPF